MTMRAWWWAFLMLPIPASAQHRPLETTPCEIFAKPQLFAGKMVRLRATVHSGFEAFGIGSPGSDREPIWLSYDEEGPLPPGRVAVTLRKDAEFRRFQKFLAAEMYPRYREIVCLGCTRYRVSATFTGRLDYSGSAGGYGHLNAFRTQLVLQSVTGVSAEDCAAAYDPAEYSTEPVRFPTGYFTGKIEVPDGNPAAHARVTALDPLTGVSGPSTLTDARGVFRLEVPPGNYLIGVNAEGPGTTTYYPGTQDRLKAEWVAIADVEEKVIHIRLMRDDLPR